MHLLAVLGIWPQIAGSSFFPNKPSLSFVGSVANYNLFWTSIDPFTKPTDDGGVHSGPGTVCSLISFVTNPFLSFTLNKVAWSAILLPTVYLVWTNSIWESLLKVGLVLPKATIARKESTVVNVSSGSWVVIIFSFFLFY